MVSLVVGDEWELASCSQHSTCGGLAYAYEIRYPWGAQPEEMVAAWKIVYKGQSGLGYEVSG